MARKLIRDLFVKLGVHAETTKAEDFDRAVDGAKKTMQAASAIALGFAGALATVGAGLLASTLHLTEVGDSIDKASQRASTGAEAFQELSKAAEYYGQNSEVMEKSLEKLTRSMFDAEQGAKAQQAAFGLAGVNWREYDTAADAIMALSDGITGLTDTQQRGVAETLLGEEGARLLPLLRQGSAEIARLREEARQDIIPAETVQAAANLTDNLMRMKDAARAVVFEFGGAMIPVLDDAAVFVREVLVYTRPLVRGFLDLVESTIGLRAVLVGLGVTVLGLLSAAGLLGLLATVAGLAGSLATMGAAVASVMTVLGPVTLAILAVGAAIQTSLLALAPPLAAMLLATVGWIAGVVFVLEDLYNWLNGGDSVFGAFINHMKRAHPEAAAFFEAIEDGVRFIWELLQLLPEIGRLLLEGGWAVATVAVQGLSDAVERFLGILGDVAAFSFGPLLEQLASMSGRFESFSATLESGTGMVRGLRQGLGTISIPGDALVGAGSQSNNTTNNSSMSVHNSFQVTTPSPLDAAYQTAQQFQDSLTFGQAALTGAR